MNHLFSKLNKPDTNSNIYDDVLDSDQEKIIEEFSESAEISSKVLVNAYTDDHKK